MVISKYSQRTVTRISYLRMLFANCDVVMKQLLDALFSSIRYLSPGTQNDLVLFLEELINSLSPSDALIMDKAQDFSQKNLSLFIRYVNRIRNENQ